MERARERQWSFRLGRLFASLAKKLQYPALASVPVSAAMLHRVDAVSPDQTLADAAQLCTRGMGSVPVIERGRAVGVVTRDSLAHAISESGPRATVASAASNNVLVVDPSTPASEVLAQLRSHPDAVALVVDHEAPMGLLTADQLQEYLTSVEKAA